MEALPNASRTVSEGRQVRATAVEDRARARRSRSIRQHHGLGLHHEMEPECTALGRSGPLREKLRFEPQGAGEYADQREHQRLGWFIETGQPHAGRARLGSLLFVQLGVDAPDQLGSHITYGDHDDWLMMESDITDLVRFCLELGPCTTGILLDAAYGVIMSVPTEFTHDWLRQITTALSRFRWPGADLLQSFVKCGYFDPEEMGKLDADAKNDLFSEIVPEFMVSIIKQDMRSAQRALDEITATFDTDLPKKG